MTNAADPRAVTKARRIHNAQHAKAVEIAPLAVDACRRAGVTADRAEFHLAGQTDEVWLRMAHAVGKAGGKGTDVPSPTTRGIVIDLVEADLSR